MTTKTLARTKMVKNNPSSDAARRPNDSQGKIAKGWVPARSISLKSFLKDGTDREFRELVYGLTSLFNVMVQNRRQFAAYIDVTEAQTLIMTLIAEAQISTVGKIAERLAVTQQFVTQEVGGLIKKGIVEKRINEADRRSALLSLTSKGRNLLDELGPLRCATNDTTFRSLTGDKPRVLIDMIHALVRDGQVALHDLQSPERSGEKAPSAQ
jgi:DNA-binding MarR family transcriptional regulator